MIDDASDYLGAEKANTAQYLHKQQKIHKQVQIITYLFLVRCRLISLLSGTARLWLAADPELLACDFLLPCEEVVEDGLDCVCPSSVGSVG